MRLDRRFGFAAFIGGALILGLAYLFAQTPADEVVYGFTGRYVVGAVAIMICGVLLALFSPRN